MHKRPRQLHCCEPGLEQRTNSDPHRGRRLPRADIDTIGKHRSRAARGTSSLQIEAIEQREIDVGLLRLPESALPVDVVFTPLMEEPLLLAMHAGHRLANVPSIKLKDLRD
jgi:DNA-binding transcriptional LysR family regulator